MPYPAFGLRVAALRPGSLSEETAGLLPPPRAEPGFARRLYTSELGWAENVRCSDRSVSAGGGRTCKHAKARTAPFELIHRRLHLFVVGWGPQHDEVDDSNGYFRLLSQSSATGLTCALPIGRENVSVVQPETRVVRPHAHAKAGVWI